MDSVSQASIQIQSTPPPPRLLQYVFKFLESYGSLEIGIQHKLLCIQMLLIIPQNV